MSKLKLSTQCKKLHDKVTDENLRSSGNKSVLLDEATVHLTKAETFLEAAERNG